MKGDHIVHVAMKVDVFETQRAGKALAICRGNFVQLPGLNEAHSN